VTLLPTKELAESRRQQSLDAHRSGKAASRITAATDQLLPRAAHWEKQYLVALLVLDTTLVAAAVGGGVFLRFGEAHDVTVANAAVAFLLAPAWVALLQISGAYDRERIDAGAEQFKAIFEASVRMAAVTAFFSYVTKSEVSRGFFLIALPAGFFALVLGRLAARAGLHSARRRGRCLQRVLAVGAVGDVEHLAAQLARGDHHGLRVVGACVVGPHRAVAAQAIPVLGVPFDARRAAAEVRADTVAVTSSGVLGRDGLRQLAWQLEGSESAY